MIASEMSAINKSNEINYCLRLWFGIESIQNVYITHWPFGVAAERVGLLF